MGELKTRIVLRHDTSWTWQDENPILLDGEIGLETDTGLMKIGDGVSYWNDIQYAYVREITDSIDNARNNCTQIELTVNQSHTDALNTIKSPNKGDMAVLIEVINDDKKSYTAYVYDGKWKAMDGNYRADNVYFDDDLTYTVAIGTLAKPSSGSAKFAAKGKNVEQVLSSLMAQEANPTATKPAVSFTSATGFGTYEVGTVVNLGYAATLSAGSYTYGPATGITAQSWIISCTGQTDALDTPTGVFENIVAEANGKTITATANYNQGTIPKTNLGNEYPSARIAAGTASKATAELKGVRYMFWGPVTDASATINSALIRGLANKKATGTGTLTTFGADAGAKKVIVAVPTGRKITKVTMPSALNADVTSLFVKQETTVAVNGANGYTSAAYDVYVYQPASIDSGETYSVVIG